ncbi:MAG: hypothetical protein L0Z46_08825 [Nitrospiraceae bacterium]|nr:hypothetical protein [Nitrospiraceae bacterium]
MYIPIGEPVWSLGESQPKPQPCDDRGIPDRMTIVPFTPNRVRCAKVVFGEADPAGVISRAVARAIEMLDNTIGELVNARSRVCQGDPPAWPLLGDITLCWLKNGLSVNVDDIRVWTSGTFVNRSVAEVIRRLRRIRNLIASNVIRYVCNGSRYDPAKPPPCGPRVWAWVWLPLPCPDPTRRVPRIVHLCRDFWVPKAGVDPKVHAEFQAQTVIHEAAHLYYCITHDKPSRTIGGAECVSQFVAATNGGPIDPDFTKFCARAVQCHPSGAAGQPGISGLGFAAGPGSERMRIVRTIFRPENAIRLKGRPAVRR